MVWEILVFLAWLRVVQRLLSVVAQDIDDYIDTTRQIRTDNRGILRDHTELINKLRYTWARKK